LHAAARRRDPRFLGLAEIHAAGQFTHDQNIDAAFWRSMDSGPRGRVPSRAQRAEFANKPNSLRMRSRAAAQGALPLGWSDRVQAGDGSEQDGVGTFAKREGWRRQSFAGRSMPAQPTGAS